MLQILYFQSRIHQSQNKHLLKEKNKVIDKEGHAQK